MPASPIRHGVRAFGWRGHLRPKTASLQHVVYSGRQILEVTRDDRKRDVVVSVTGDLYGRDEPPTRSQHSRSKSAAVQEVWCADKLAYVGLADAPHAGRGRPRWGPTALNASSACGGPQCAADPFAGSNLCAFAEIFKTDAGPVSSERTRGDACPRSARLQVSAAERCEHQYRLVSVIGY